MKFDNGSLILEPSDLEMMLSEITKGLTIKDVFFSRLFLSGIDKADISEIQATAISLSPYENLIYSIINLL